MLLEHGQHVHVPHDLGEVPFALTHWELRFGSADWSEICSRDSGGS